MHELLGRFQKKVSAHSQNMRRGCENECARASHMCVDLIVIKKKRRMLQASNKNNNSVQMKYAMAVVTGAAFFFFCVSDYYYAFDKSASRFHQ